MTGAPGKACERDAEGGEVTGIRGDLGCDQLEIREVGSVACTVTRQQGVPPNGGVCANVKVGQR